MKRFGPLLSACVALLAVTACGREPAPPMRIGADIWAGNEMIAVAEHVGRLDPQRIRRVEFSNDQEILRALRNGSIEAGALILDETLLAAQDGLDLVIVAAVDSSIGSDAILSRAPIGSLQQLKGKRVGVQFNSGSLQVLRRGLATAQLDTADADVINVPPDRHLSSFMSGQIDAVVTYDPMRTQLLAKGAVTLYDSSAIAGDVINVIAIRRDYLETHLDEGRELVQAWWSGADAFQHSDAVRAWVAHRLDLEPPQLKTAFDTIQLLDAQASAKLIAGHSPPLLETLRRFHGFMRENGRLTNDIAFDSMLRPPPGWQP